MNDPTEISTRDSGTVNPETTNSVAPSAPDFAVQPSYVRTVFFGPDGLRAGWGFAFYVLMLYVLRFLVSRWVGALLPVGSELWSMMLEELVALVAAVVPAVVLARVEGRPWGA